MQVTVAVWLWGLCPDRLFSVTCLRITVSLWAALCLSIFSFPNGFLSLGTTPRRATHPRNVIVLTVNDLQWANRFLSTLEHAPQLLPMSLSPSMPRMSNAFLWLKKIISVLMIWLFFSWSFVTCSCKYVSLMFLSLGPRLSSLHSWHLGIHSRWKCKIVWCFQPYTVNASLNECSSAIRPLLEGVKTHSLYLR